MDEQGALHNYIFLTLDRTRVHRLEKLIDYVKLFKVDKM